jgi:hypothetical protein
VNADLATQMVTTRAAQTQSSVQLAVFKKTHDMQTDLLETLMASALSAPPPGQGLKVDKQA